MSRDVNGTYTLPSSVNPVVTGTKITTSWAITTLGDIATALTESLATTGVSHMTGAFKGFAGTQALPGWSWSVETGSGFYRAGAGDFRWAIGTADILKITAAGLWVYDPVGPTARRAGYRDIPVREASADTTITPSDSGKQVRHPSADVTARNWTIQANATSAYDDGATITLINMHGAGVVTITPTDTLRVAGSGTSGARTLAADGVVTLVWSATELTWMISGAGLL